MELELRDTTLGLLAEIAEPSVTRKDIAETYGLALLSTEETDWPAVNRAIVKRWSVSALGYIKKLAWRDVKGVI